MRASETKIALIVIVFLSIMNNSVRSQNNFIWGKQFGTDKEEYAMNHLTDKYGNVYIAGKTLGVMDGKNYGRNDGFITKIDTSGNTIWSRQFGSDGEEDIQWSAIDYTGNIYITGSTTGTLKGKNFGKEDVFIVKYNSKGELEWEQQIGTDSMDIAKGIYADNKGYIYITGITGGQLGQHSYGKTDCFIIKLDSMGNQLFNSQFGTTGDDCGYAITAGRNSDIFVCGTTSGSFAGNNKGFIDGFTGQFTTTGKLVRYNQFGSEGFDIAMILSVDDANNIYIGGSTSGNFGSQQIGEGDAFLIKINERGDILWNNQFGTKNNDGVRSIDINSKMSDNILVSGILNLPPAQGFIRMFKPDGTLIWERNFIAQGKNIATSGKDVGFDEKGNFYHMGLTGANLFSPLIGEADVYLVKMKLDNTFLKR